MGCAEVRAEENKHPARSVSCALHSSAKQAAQKKQLDRALKERDKCPENIVSRQAEPGNFCPL